MPFPQSAHNLIGVLGCSYTLPGKVCAYPLNIAFQDEVRLAVAITAADLWEVDEGDFSLPIQDVIGREVTMYHAMNQHQLDVTHGFGKKFTGFLLPQFNCAQGRASHFRVT